MAADYAEKEREFLDNLRADTGRDLAAWMAAISASGLEHRNDIIDWLRRQGFTFSRASWLERIHHNGGRPIYADKPASGLRAALRSARAARSTDPAPVENKAAAPEPAPGPPKQSPPNVPAESVPERADDSGLEAQLAKGKAFRPLARYLLDEVRRLIPGADFVPGSGQVSLCNPEVFAVLAITGKELRLGLDLGERPFDAHLQRARIAGAPPRISHAVVLTDARQVGEELMQLVATANARVNGSG